METTALCSLGTFPNPTQTCLLLFIFLWAVFGIGSHSSEAFLKIVCLGQLEINSLLPFLKLKMFSCLNISQYFHLHDYLLEIRTLEKQVWERSPLLYVWCYSNFSGLLRMGRTLFRRDSWSFSPTIGSSCSEIPNPQPSAHRKRAKFSAFGRSHLGCLCQPRSRSQAEAQRSPVPQVLCRANTAVAVQVRGCPGQQHLQLRRTGCVKPKPQQAGSLQRGDIRMGRSQLDTLCTV